MLFVFVVLAVVPDLWCMVHGQVEVCLDHSRMAEDIACAQWQSHLEDEHGDAVTSA